MAKSNQVLAIHRSALSRRGLATYIYATEQHNFSSQDRRRQRMRLMAVVNYIFLSRVYVTPICVCASVSLVQAAVVCSWLAFREAFELSVRAQRSCCSQSPFGNECAKAGLQNGLREDMSCCWGLSNCQTVLKSTSKQYTSSRCCSP